MEEEVKDEKLPGGVETVSASGFHQNHSIICRKCGKMYLTREASAGTEILNFELKTCCRC